MLIHLAVGTGDFGFTIPAWVLSTCSFCAISKQNRGFRGVHTKFTSMCTVVQHNPMQNPGQLQRSHYFRESTVTFALVSPDHSYEKMFTALMPNHAETTLVFANCCGVLGQIGVGI